MQYCIAKFRTEYIDGVFFYYLIYKFIILIIIFLLLLSLSLLLLLLLLLQAFLIRKTDRIKQAKYRKYLNCGHMSSKQIRLYVSVNY